MKTEVLGIETDSLIRAAKLLSLNEVVALPTETVYGLAGNAFDETAVKKIFTAKGRPAFDPLIVHISERYLNAPHSLIPSLVEDGIIAADVLSATELPKIYSVMKSFWPGPLTIILPRGPKIPDLVTAAQPTVGIRCPKHPVFQQVLSKIHFPLAAPSANRFGRISPTNASHVIDELNGRISAIVDGGACEIGVESTIIRIDFPFQVTLLRPGKISAEELEVAFQCKITLGLTRGEVILQSKISPGALDQHYAPRKPLYLLPHAFSDEKTPKFLSHHGLHQKLGLLKMNELSPTNDLNEIAHLLFKRLRELDEDESIETIIAEPPSSHQSGLGAAVADRLRRASRNKPVF